MTSTTTVKRNSPSKWVVSLTGDKIPISDIENSPWYCEGEYLCESSLHNITCFMQEYDCAVALACGGLSIGYFFAQCTGKNVWIVRLRRKGQGASWNPCSKRPATLVPGAKVLVLDNDVLLGRTAMRAAEELRLLGVNPDILLNHRVVPVRKETYHKYPHILPSSSGEMWNGKYYQVDTLPIISEYFGKVKSLRDIEEGRMT